MNHPRRHFLQAAALASLAPIGCLRLRPAAAFDAVVTLENGRASHPNIPNFASVRAAIDAAPADGKRIWRIRITPGRWHEKLVIDKPNIRLIGDDRETCIVSYDAAAGHLAPDGEPWGTWRCASIIVRAPGFSVHSMSIENGFDYLGEIAHPTLQAIGANGAQAVALMLDAGSDCALLEDVNISGQQDTLFVDSGRCLLRNCRVAGSVDFIFGGGQCVLEHCEILSRFRPGKQRQGYVAVPSTLASQRYGLVFRDCRLLKESAVPARSVALGRPWRPTRTFSDGRYGDPAIRGNAAFIDCWMDDHIDAVGWDAMTYTARDGSRVLFTPQEARLAEYASRGPGALHDAIRIWLSAEESAAYATARVLQGWDYNSTAAMF
ncbi:pectinesterase A [Pseudolysobacter antarcticus]|uniref:Pectinesterase n=1 Tax=Pseudolysobacter antarcticus TaxID=2511995 RepID=A0A411HFZ5_9GAMM|nr:pectinesterase family protein [Pseudolysobacter antarcticus]QBB69412.1 pectinesterase A [Pseudolysobacter antarcticus]